MATLAPDYEHLAEEHSACWPEAPDHSCRCFISPPCNACVDCPAWIEEAWREEPRWKIGCCNWTTPGIVHFVAYLAIDGEAEFMEYTHTYAEAWAHIEKYAPAVAQWLAGRNGEQNHE